MNIIIDSNIFFSALIRDSLVRRLILEYNDFFLFPEYIFEEMKAHQDELLEKSGMDREDFNALIQLLLRKVVIAPHESLHAYEDEALDIVKDIDRDDVLFVACALAYPGSIIWSDDKGLKKQKKVPILNTPEIIHFFSEL